MKIPRKGFRVIFLVSGLVAIVFPSFGHAEKSLKAHVHGGAQLTIAMEDDKSLQVDLDCPADSIIGFEHKARSAQDQKTQVTALAKLEKGLSLVIEFPAGLGCKVSDTKVGMEAEEHEGKPAAAGASHGEHSDVNASYALKCEKSVMGASAKVGLIGLFQKIKTVSVKVLGTNAQNEKKITQNGQALEF